MAIGTKETSGTTEGMAEVLRDGTTAESTTECGGMTGSTASASSGIGTGTGGRGSGTEESM